MIASGTGPTRVHHGRYARYLVERAAQWLGDLEDVTLSYLHGRCQQRLVVRFSVDEPTQPQEMVVLCANMLAIYLAGARIWVPPSCDAELVAALEALERGRREYLAWLRDLNHVWQELSDDGSEGGGFGENRIDHCSADVITPPMPRSRPLSDLRDVIAALDTDGEFGRLLGGPAVGGGGGYA